MVTVDTFQLEVQHWKPKPWDCLCRADLAIPAFHRAVWAQRQVLLAALPSWSASLIGTCMTMPSSPRKSLTLCFSCFWTEKTHPKSLLVLSLEPRGCACCWLPVEQGARRGYLSADFIQWLSSCRLGLLYRSLEAAARSPEWEQHLPCPPRSIFLSTHPHEHLNCLCPAFTLILQCITSDTQGPPWPFSLQFVLTAAHIPSPRALWEGFPHLLWFQHPLGMKAGGEASLCPAVLCWAFQKSWLVQMPSICSVSYLGGSWGSPKGSRSNLNIVMLNCKVILWGTQGIEIWCKNIAMLLPVFLIWLFDTKK